MHRIDYPGYVTVSGERRFIDEALPTVEGTTIGAGWMNAVQEELCSILAFCGVTPNTSAAADMTDGWTQLKDAIFQSGNIGTVAIADNAITRAKMADNSVGTSEILDDSVTSAKIHSVPLAKAYGAIGITVSGATWLQDEIALRYGATLPTGFASATLGASGLSFDDSYDGTTHAMIGPARFAEFDVGTSGWVLTNGRYVKTVNTPLGGSNRYVLSANLYYLNTNSESVTLRSRGEDFSISYSTSPQLMTISTDINPAAFVAVAAVIMYKIE